ncbi:MAG: S41 family peptidase [Chitinophagaceae bacterium]
MRSFCAIAVLCVVLASSCSVAKNYNPSTRYAPQKLQQDYDIFQSILEEEHPGLYWYTPKDSMDYFFARGKNLLTDSMTETAFRAVLSSVVSKIHCGHTSVRASKAYLKLADSLRPKPFPISLKIWPDTALVTANINRKDSQITRGVIVTAIDGKPMQQIVDSLFQHLPSDGYNLTHKYQLLSNRSGFGSLYTAVFGHKALYKIDFIDTLGRQRTSMLNLYPPKDTTARQRPLPRPKISKRKQKKGRLAATRSLQFDTSSRTAFMNLNTFTRDGGLPRFCKKSFKQLHKRGTEHLIIDLRGNGGGSVTNSNLLTKYISKERFKLADSLYAITCNSNWGKYQQNRFFNWLFMLTMTKKREDGKYHFGYFERKHFKPKKRFHFDGDVYILTGGNTFSASTLFIKSIDKQPNVYVVGEETGGGAYGNNAWLIPDVTLPNTKVVFRLPLFRLVIDKDAPKGRGAMPHVPSLPTTEAIRRNVDYKANKAYELIKAKEDFSGIE